MKKILTTLLGVFFLLGMVNNATAQQISVANQAPVLVKTVNTPQGTINSSTNVNIPANNGTPLTTQQRRAMVQVEQNKLIAEQANLLARLNNLVAGSAEQIKIQARLAEIAPLIIKNAAFLN